MLSSDSPPIIAKNWLPQHSVAKQSPPAVVSFKLCDSGTIPQKEQNSGHWWQCHLCFYTCKAKRIGFQRDELAPSAAPGSLPSLVSKGRSSEPTPHTESAEAPDEHGLHGCAGAWSACSCFLSSGSEHEQDLLQRLSAPPQRVQSPEAFSWGLQSVDLLPQCDDSLPLPVQMQGRSIRTIAKKILFGHGSLDMKLESGGPRVERRPPDGR